VNRDRHVILIGPRASGKTTAGRALARLLHWPFIDTDELVEQRAGRGIAEIFATEGEAAFRALEEAAVAAALQEPPSAVRSPRRAAARRAAGLCFWLTVPVEDLYRRMQHDPRTPVSRPPLTQRSGIDELRELSVLRTPLYRALASHTISAAGRSPEEIARELHRLIRLSQ
jgi:shikimate kinase